MHALRYALFCELGARSTESENKPSPLICTTSIGGLAEDFNHFHKESGGTVNDPSFYSCAYLRLTAAFFWFAGEKRSARRRGQGNYRNNSGPRRSRHSVAVAYILQTISEDNQNGKSTDNKSPGKSGCEARSQGSRKEAGSQDGGKTCSQGSSKARSQGSSKARSQGGGQAGCEEACDQGSRKARGEGGS
jgi:hypothetical protein